MNAMRTGRKRHIHTIVDEHACPSATNGCNRLLHQIEQRSVRHVPFTDLNEMNAGAGGDADAASRRVLGVRTLGSFTCAADGPWQFSQPTTVRSGVRLGELNPAGRPKPVVWHCRQYESTWNPLSSKDSPACWCLEWAQLS